jgi:hypothetical protein
MKEIPEVPFSHEATISPDTGERAGLRDRIDSFLHTSRQLGDRILRSTVERWETLRQKNTVVRELTDASLWKAEWDTATRQVKSLPRPKVGEAYSTATAWVSTTYMIERGEAGIFNPSAYKERFKGRMPWYKNQRSADAVDSHETTTTTVNNKNFSRKTGVALAVVLGAGALYLLNETYPGNDVLGNRVLDPLDVDANLLDGEFAVDFFDQDTDGRVNMGGEQPLDAEAQQVFNEVKETYEGLAEELDQEIPDIEDGDWSALNEWGDELNELDDELSLPDSEDGIIGPEAPEIDSPDPEVPEQPEPEVNPESHAEGEVFYVEPTHGITHEIMDYAAAHEYGTITPEESYRIYQQLEAQHANQLLDILNGANDTYVDEKGDTLLSRAGNARWDPAVESELRRMLAGMR